MQGRAANGRPARASSNCTPYGHHGTDVWYVHTDINAPHAYAYTLYVCTQYGHHGTDELHQIAHHTRGNPHGVCRGTRQVAALPAVRRGPWRPLKRPQCGCSMSPGPGRHCQPTLPLVGVACHCLGMYTAILLSWLSVSAIMAASPLANVAGDVGVVRAVRRRVVATEWVVLLRRAGGRKTPR